jgi:Spy/CpxP family protein refolding chaperone
MGGGMGGGPMMILGSEDVQKDIKFTDDQKEKLKDFRAKQQEARQALGQDATPEQRQEAGKKAAEESTKFLKDTLTEEQNKRLKEIGLQNTLKTNAAALGANEEYATALKITDDQKAKIKEIGDQARKDRQDIMGGGGGGGGGGGARRQPPTPEQQKKLDALSKEASDKIMEVLTGDQKKMLEDMKGKPFEGKITFGGGRRPGAGGN